MGAMKQIDIELQDMDVEVDFGNYDDIFDLIVDARLTNTFLSPLLLSYVVSRLDDDERLGNLYQSAEFVEALEWQYV